MVGGNKSFGLGRYIGSPVEEILPITLVPPHTEKKRLNVAVQLVIDKSRSMAEDSRLEFAKAAAREVVASLRDDDYIGVIGFEEVAFIALPISRVDDVRSTASDRISRLFPANRTNLYPALEEGRRGLSRVNAGRKHLIVLTDGQIPDQGPIYFGLIKQLRLLGITVSTVLVGADAPDAFLVEVANQGGGSFYQTNDPRNLPRIFLSDIKVATGEQTLKEDPEAPVAVGPDGVTSTSIRSFPSLRGFVETLPRSGAATELVVSEADKRYPLLDLVASRLRAFDSLHLKMQTGGGPLPGSAGLELRSSGQTSLSRHKPSRSINPHLLNLTSEPGLRAAMLSSISHSLMSLRGVP